MYYSANAAGKFFNFHLQSVDSQTLIIIQKHILLFKRGSISIYIYYIIYHQVEML